MRAMTAPSPRRKVLFVEDESSLRTSYQRYFGERYDLVFATTGAEALVGKTAVVTSPTQVRVAGEIWEARPADALVVGEQVDVTGVDGLTLQVSPRSRAPR